ncbi:recombinase family protein [Lactobacillus reuteri]|uniref:recombinase family protein n=1 Tax=Limosilactobacillus reuteri TaxID=1598 RepID=UPI00146F6361|nr:recombinase family protein [Limosilactobacillus reuteri]NMV48856.1 recombinase family protein [Limosilactobacillus reuteri]NMV50538.1 recombinase family protein [Limosilactobacillus reuteri]NMV63811.1 recombinase family protein [Limosilactobacillus reuteri]
MALIFYARVSSKQQNLDRQIARAKEVKADKVFVDKFSGKTTDRPGLKDMMDYVREGDAVEIVSLDRLSRNYRDIQHLVQQLKNKKVKLIVDDLPQTNTGNKLIDQFMLDMMVNLMGFVAQNEREKILERQRQGIEQAKKRGVYRGRPFKYAPNSNNREGRLVYERIKKQYLSGDYTSKAQLAKDNEISRQQLYRIIRLIDNE